MSTPQPAMAVVPASRKRKASDELGAADELAAPAPKRILTAISKGTGAPMSRADVLSMLKGKSAAKPKVADAAPSAPASASTVSPITSRRVQPVIKRPLYNGANSAARLAKIRAIIAAEGGTPATTSPQASDALDLLPSPKPRAVPRVGAASPGGAKQTTPRKSVAAPGTPSRRGTSPSLAGAGSPSLSAARRATTPRRPAVLDVPETDDELARGGDETEDEDVEMQDEGSVGLPVRAPPPVLTAAATPVRRLFQTPTKPKASPASTPRTPTRPVAPAVVDAFPGISAAQLRSTTRFTADELFAIQDEILPKLTGRERVPLVGYTNAYNDVHALLRETIKRGESNSAIILGPHGCGKTLLVENALHSFIRADATHQDFLVVRLDGAIQTDDRAALRAIARQLQPADDSSDLSNADLMTALVAILAHPSEFGESGEPLGTILLLDNFHRFAQQPRQTLLYNLFDIAQSKKAPVCVLGLTSAVDAFDMLEKRVRSRFSHRIIQLAGHATPQGLAKVCARLMSCKAELADEQPLPAVVPSAEGSDLPNGQSNGHKKTSATVSYKVGWNKLIEAELRASDGALKNLIEMIHLTTRDPRDFARIVLPSIAGWARTGLVASTIEPTVESDPATVTGETKDAIEADDTSASSSGRVEPQRETRAEPLWAPPSFSNLVKDVAGSLPNGKLDLCGTLSLLEIALLICVARLELRHSPGVLGAAVARIGRPRGRPAKTSASTINDDRADQDEYRINPLNTTNSGAAPAGAGGSGSGSGSGAAVNKGPGRIGSGVTFAHAYAEYAKLADRHALHQRASVGIVSTAATARRATPELARTAWSRLVGTALITSTSSTAGAGAGGVANAGGGAGAGGAAGGKGLAEFRTYRAQVGLLELVRKLKGIDGVPATLIGWAREVA